MINFKLLTLITFTSVKAYCLFIFFHFCQTTILNAQPPPCGNPAVMSSFCRDACIICDIDGYTGRNGSGAKGEAPPGFCTTILHNAKWIAFIAGSEDLRIRMRVSNCTQNRGLELGIYEGIDCKNYRLVSNCRGGATSPVNNNTSAEFYNTEPLTIGQYYYLVMDGSNGTVCNWTLEILSGSTKVPGLASSGSVSGPDEVCLHAEATFETIPQVGATIYSWSIDGIKQSNAGIKAQLSFTEAGNHEVCVEAANACDKAAPVCKTITVLPAITINPVLSDYNGYQIACYGGNDGFISLGAAGGQSPLTFSWSGGETYQSIDNLSAGSYEVTIQDANNCVLEANFDLLEPDLLSYSVLQTDAGCSGTDNGVIEISGLTGGTSPFSYFLNGIESTSPVFGQLSPGTFLLKVTDGNACADSVSIIIDELPIITVDAGSDTILFLGDSLQLHASISGVKQDISWEPVTFVSCADCLDPIVNPVSSTMFIIQVVSDLGCIIHDTILVSVSNRYRIFVPTAFSPNGDNINDVLSIGAGKEVEEINFFRVHSRWGELLFEELIFQANTDIGWDGYFKGRLMDQGVFTWSLEAKFIDGSTKSLQGESTLLR